MCNHYRNNDVYDPYYTGPYCYGPDHEEVKQSASQIHDAERRWYDDQWNEYLNGRIDFPPDDQGG